MNATQSDWRLRQQYEADPDCFTMDLHGNPGLPWQQQRASEYIAFLESRTWFPEIFQEAGRVGLWNQYENHLMVPARYDEFLDLPELSTQGGNDCLEIIARRGNRWGTICSDGNDSVLCPFLFERVTYFEFGYLLVEKDGQLGLWSSLEKGFIIPVKAERIWFDEETYKIHYLLKGQNAFENLEL